MKKLLLAFALLVAFIGTAQTTFTGTVVKIKDGDTVVVLDSTKTMITIRLAGVDAPEKKQDFGLKAKQFTIDEVAGKLVTVKIIAKDRYGRSVAWILYDKKNLSEELLKVGLAWHYIQYDKSKFLQSLEDKAKESKVGLWSIPNPIPPSEYRKSKNKQ
jgi:micrococcal nuclease